MICKDCGVPNGVHGNLLDRAHESKREAFKEVKRLRLANQELLEALKAADELIGMEPFEHVAQEAADAHKNIRAAIAKAESLYKHSKE